MSYIRTNWQDSPSTATPINADNLNKIEEGIVDLDQRVEGLEEESKVNSFNGRTGSVSPAVGDYTSELITDGEGTVSETLRAIENNISSLGFSVVNGKLCQTYTV